MANSYGSRRLCYFLLGILTWSSGNCSEIEWTKVVQQSTHDDLVPTSGGFESDVIVVTKYDCLSLCEANKNCMGFVFVSSTFVCQLHQATWDNSVAIPTMSARFYIISERSPVTCLTGWDEFQGSCYLFDLVHMSSSFSTAQSHCTSYNSSPVHINHELENNFIKETCKQYLDANGNAVNGCWIGLSDADVEGQWRWVDNQELCGFFDWGYNNQPNEGTGANCVVLYNVIPYETRWVDEPCQYSYMPICEMDPPSA